MGDFNDILKYLRYTRRSEEAAQKYTSRSAQVIDFNYDKNTFPNEEDFVYVEKEKLNDTSFFRVIDDFTTNDTSILYLKGSSDNIEYYVKYEDISSNEARYRKLPNLSNDEIFQQNELTAVEVPLQTMFDFETNRCIDLVGEEIFIFEDFFTYNPGDIPDGTYKYKYDDEKGYFVDVSELIISASDIPKAVLKAIFETNVEVKKSSEIQPVNIFPRIRRNGNRYTLEYQRYERAKPFYSIAGKPAITLHFDHFGGLLTFLNNTLFYFFKDQEEDGFLESKITEVQTFQGIINVEARKKKVFVDNYRWFVKDLINDRSIDPLQVLFYLPRFYYNKEDKGFLWDTVINALKSNTTNSIYKKEDVVAHLIKVLGVLFYEDYPDLFLKEITTRRAGNKTLIERIISNIDGNNFNDLMLFLIRIWIKSDYGNLSRKRNHIIDGNNVLNPPICGYTSGSSWSFFYENTNFSWSNEGHLLLKVKTENGTKSYKYHPLDLIAISNANNEPIAFSVKATDHISILPAFALYAHSDVTFWKNTALAAEYAGDILSIATGLGPAWRALRIVSAVAKTTSRAQKIFMITRSAVGVMEVTAGTGKIILNATEYIKTPFGQELAKVFMWMEFASLGSEASVGVVKRLSASSKAALVKADSLLKANEITADDVNKFAKLILTETKLTLIEFKQMGHLLLGQLEGARYIVAEEFKNLAGAIAKELKAAGVQVLELSEEFFKALDGIGDELLRALGLNHLDYEFALANGGYLTTLNGKGFFASSLDDVKGFFNAMNDHLKKGGGKGRKGGKNLDKVDEAFDRAYNSIAYNRIRDGETIKIVHYGEVKKVLNTVEEAEKYLQKLYKNNFDLLKRVNSRLNEIYVDWLKKNNLELQVINTKKPYNLKIIDKTTGKVVYKGLPDYVHSYLIFHNLADFEKVKLIQQAYKVAQSSNAKFNLKTAIENLLGLGVTTKIRRSTLGAGTVPTFTPLGEAMFLKNGKLGNGKYNDVIKEGYFLAQIEQAVENIKKHKGVLKDIKLTGSRDSDFGLFWDVLGVRRAFGNVLRSKLELSIHHMDDVSKQTTGTFELVHKPLHEATLTHTGNFGILEIILNLIQ